MSLKTRPGRRNLTIAACVLAAAVGLALLAPRDSRANVVGTGTQNFNPTTDGLDFVTVHSSETLQPGYFNLGLFLNYAINSLPYFESSPQSRVSFQDTLLSADLNMGVGLLPNLDAGISLPFVLAQTAQSDSPLFRGQFNKPGNTEVRANTKYRLWGNESRGVALVASANFNRIQNDPYSGTDGGPTWNLEAAADTTFFNRLAVGVNVGHRWRNPGTPIPGAPIEPLKNQFIASTAASYLLPNTDTKLIGEIFGSFPSQRRSSDLDRSSTSLELLVGAKRDVTHNLAVHAGLGTELLNGVASPDWRIYAGLNWQFGPVFSRATNFERREEDGGERFVSRNILFKYDSDEMVGDYKRSLDELVAHLSKPPVFKTLTIEGHTDSMGSDEYNQKLSQRRAEAIRKYLIREYKLDGAQITAIGYGESRPIADNGNYQGRQANRRVEFRITR